MEPRGVRTGACPSCYLNCKLISQFSFDNSGQRMSYPTWQSKQSNIDRTSAIIKTIASKFAGNKNVVPVIAPLNEYISTPFV